MESEDLQIHGLETKPLQLNARVVLQRLHSMLGQRGRIHYSGPWPEVFLAEARNQGWQPAEAGEPVEAAVVVEQEGQPHPPPVQAPGLCLIRGTDGPVPQGYTILWQRPLRLYQTLGTWCRRIFSRLPIVGGLTAPMAGVLDKLGVASVMGDRSCALRIPGFQEVYCYQEGTAPEVKTDARGDALKDNLMSVFGCGYFPLLPGTLAAAVVPVIFLPLVLLVPASVWVPLLALVFVLSTVLCVLLEPWSERYYLVKDAREVVLDEVAGMSLTLLLCPPAVAWILILPAFLLFRFFDIVKPAIHWVENLGIRGGIVWDDLLAGLYAGLICLGLGFLLLFVGLG